MVFDDDDDANKLLLFKFVLDGKVTGFCGFIGVNPANGSKIGLLLDVVVDGLLLNGSNKILFVVVVDAPELGVENKSSNKLLLVFDDDLTGSGVEKSAKSTNKSFVSLVANFVCVGCGCGLE